MSNKHREPDFKAVGFPVPRADGIEKVSGRTRYAADVDCEGILWGKILRGPYPHARIVRIDVSKARHVPGLKAVVTGEDANDWFKHCEKLSSLPHAKAPRGLRGGDLKTRRTADRLLGSE